MKNRTLKLISKPFLLVIFITITLTSCGDSSNNQPATAEGFKVIENELKDKFGNDAYYTDLKVLYIKGIGNTVSTTVTDAPESLKMGEWDLSQNNWTQRSEVTIEIPQGTKASDYMFQLNDDINLYKLGGLVETSISKLTTDKNIENPILSIAFIKFPKNGDLSEARYVVRLEPKNGGTSFTFYYTLNGKLIEMDY